MRQDTIPASTRATSSIAEIFYEILTSRFDLDLEEFEDVALEAGHKIMASAFGLALEALDTRLCAEMPDGWRVHDRRTRRLLTKMGDVSYCKCQALFPLGGKHFFLDLGKHFFPWLGKHFFLLCGKEFFPCDGKYFFP